MDIQDLAGKVSDFASTTNGKIILGVGGLVGVVAVVSTIRRNQRTTPATAGSNIPIGASPAAQPGTAGSASGIFSPVVEFLLVPPFSYTSRAYGTRGQQFLMSVLIAVPNSIPPSTLCMPTITVNEVNIHNRILVNDNQPKLTHSTSVVGQQSEIRRGPILSNRSPQCIK